MNVYIVIILLYLAVLTVMNFWKSRRVKSQDDMMLAGRQIPVYKMVFTLICTWIGSGTFIAGAEFAAKAGWSSLWQPAGAWIGIVIIYFLAAKIRTFGQYTVGDILEERYGPVARIFGALAIIVSFTVIVSYQFKAGGYILNAISDGAISTDQGLFMAAAFVIIFTFVGGMIAIANTDLPNGIIILSSTVISTPLVILAAGGWSKIKAVLPASHFQAFSPEFGANPALKIPAIGISTLLLLLGVQSLYQKFYSARNPREAKKAAGIWVIGTIIVEGVAIVIAVFASSYFWQELQAGTMDHAAVIVQAAKKMIFLPVGVLLLGAATAVVISTGMNYLLSPTTTLVHDIYERFLRKRPAKPTADIEPPPPLHPLPPGEGNQKVPDPKTVEPKATGPDPTEQQSARLKATGPEPTEQQSARLKAAGPEPTEQQSARLKAALPESANQQSAGLKSMSQKELIKSQKEAVKSQRGLIWLQKGLIIVVGIVAFFLAWKMQSVLESAYFAYTIYGVAITPALLAALASKKVTRTAGLVSIVSGTVITLFLKLSGSIWPSIIRPAGDPNGDPFGIPILYPALAVSVLSLLIVSMLTRKPSAETLKKFFPDKG